MVQLTIQRYLKRSLLASLTTLTLFMLNTLLFSSCDKIVLVTAQYYGERESGTKVNIAMIDPKTGEVDSRNEVVADQNLILKLRKALADDGGKILPDKMLDDVGSVLQRASRDSEASLLLLKLMEQEGKEFFDTIRAGRTIGDVVREMATVVNDMAGLEELFRLGGDEIKALQHDVETSDIPAERLVEYKKNPKLMQLDTRRRVYFKFVTLAAAAGFLS